MTFPEEVQEVDLIASGSNVLICPARPRLSWNDLFERGPVMSKDFMAERMIDPLLEERDFSSWERECE
jgi:virulence-associated protein VagC